MMHLIINCGSSKTVHISELLTSLQLANKTIELKNLTAKDYQNIDKIIISGAPILLSKVDNASYIKKLAFLLDLNIPVLGICFGHQMLGILEGGKVTLTTEAREKEVIHQLKPNDKIFTNIPQNSEFEEDHCESVSLPNTFELLANSRSCNNEVMKHKTRLWYGVQFHPEVTDVVGKLLIENWLNLCY
ncbi:GMP synthase [Flammeovirga pectinis]|uniref:GMP synthase n=1 Tax=Flammeovirga pectinis TaxID=2494373 RepID=A0A3S9NZK8_9BACT|nr:gamma-glutamyl-gamma-aminobutyrate hydrolase family protein [Flammeovirga pectinis]AZQ61368.1 GMP synthase [Flammeovirga pectinis]